MELLELHSVYGIKIKKRKNYGKKKLLKKITHFTALTRVPAHGAPPPLSVAGGSVC